MNNSDKTQVVKKNRQKVAIKGGNWWKNGDNVVWWNVVLALTERKAAATKFDGNKFLRKEEKDKLDQQKMTVMSFLFEIMYLQKNG